MKLKNIKKIIPPLVKSWKEALIFGDHWTNNWLLHHYDQSQNFLANIDAIDPGIICWKEPIPTSLKVYFLQSIAIVPLAFSGKVFVSTSMLPLNQDLLFNLYKTSWPFRVRVRSSQPEAIAYPVDSDRKNVMHKNAYPICLPIIILEMIALFWDAVLVQCSELSDSASSLSSDYS